jgi:EAL domain-containing protein (putative c-di-GMP-specific phosphodiesterase class I)
MPNEAKACQVLTNTVSRNAPLATPISAEALIRRRYPERGMAPPMLLMLIVHTWPIARQVAEWVLHGACRQAASLDTRRTFDPDRHQPVAVAACHW